MEEQFRAAKARGLREIAITDHVDYMYPAEPYPYQIDYGAYGREFRRVAAEFPGVRAAFGAEIGLGPGAEIAAEIARFAQAYPFDFIIGSIHDYYGGELHRDSALWRRDKREAYAEYLDYALRSFRACPAFSVAGHLDYISRYGPYPDPSLRYSEFKAETDAVLRFLIDSGKGLEVNTSGFRYGLGGVYPQPEILSAYKRLGGEILTVGSDAHRSRDVAADFDAAERAVRGAGFDKICVFRRMIPEFILIPF
jgi:histidinol-phosphatase (PHP family)